MFRLTFRTAITVLLAGGLALSAAAQTAPLPEPAGEIVLVVSGAIGAANRDGAAAFDLDMLRALDPVTVQTTTIWTEGVQSFTGPSLHQLMSSLGVSGGTLRASAINDYTVEIPMADAVEGGPIVAYLHNEEPMSVRDKGPLWIVYPYDSDAAFRVESIYSRSIWQLDRIEVLR